MFEHSCKNAGADRCGYTVQADTEEELRAAITEHARKKHKVTVMTDTIFNSLRNTARR
jgi:predicted small metal-binding protein